MDTSVLIEAHKRYYDPDIVPGFWINLAKQARRKVIFSIDRVRGEIHKHNKFLTEWADNDFTQWESTNNSSTLSKYNELMTWSAKHSRYNEKAKDRFAQAANADPWLVAHAMATGCVVVTEETYNNQITSNLPLPVVCKEFGIGCTDTFEMLRDLGIVL